MKNVEQQKVRGKYFKKSFKAKEVLRLYEAGERNFQGMILKGQSFKGQDQDLSGADFSEADIRSTNFTNVKLVGTNFTGVKCGLQRHWIVILISLAWFFIVLSGLCTFVVAALPELTLQKISTQSPTIDKASLILAVIFLILSIRKGIRIHLIIPYAGAFASTLMAFVAFISVIKFTKFFVHVFPLFPEAIKLISFLILGVCGVLLILLFHIAVVFPVGMLIIFSLGAAFEGVLIIESSGALALVGVVMLVWVVTLKQITVASIFQFALIVIGFYVGWHSLQGDKRFILVSTIATAFAATGGTSFRNADLTDANFTRAILKSTDFRKAKLTRVRWYKAKFIDRVRPGNTYLQDSQIRQWIIGKGTNKNFNHKDLRGVNLQGANLKNASFISTDLGAANLSKTTLTKACIQDWNINNQTKFDDVICEEIYLKEGNQERIPHDSNRTFKPGEFAKYTEKALNTVDLIFTDGIDWRAFFASFQALQDEYGAESIGVQAIERKSGDTFIVRIEVPTDSNKADIESHTKQLYKSNLKALEDKYRTQLNAKDSEIEIYKQKSADILELAKLAASRPITVEAKAVADQPKFQQNFNAPVYGNAQNVEGNQNIYAPEEKQTLAEAAEEIQKLLKQLEQTNTTATEEEKIIYVNEETSSGFKKRTVSALKAGVETGIEEFLDNPYVNVGKAIVKAWIKPE